MSVTKGNGSLQVPPACAAPPRGSGTRGRPQELPGQMRSVFREESSCVQTYPGGRLATALWACAHALEKNGFHTRVFGNHLVFNTTFRYKTPFRMASCAGEQRRWVAGCGRPRRSPEDLDRSPLRGRAGRAASGPPRVGTEDTVRPLPACAEAALRLPGRPRRFRAAFPVSLTAAGLDRPSHPRDLFMQAFKIIIVQQ